MPNFEHVDAAQHEAPQDLFPRQGPVPYSRVEHFLEPRDATLVARKPSSTVSLFGTTSCAPNDNSGGCEKPIDGTTDTTIPIVLGVVIPLTVALLIMIILHRRHVKKLRQEDANDRHKSLDFGMGENRANGRSKNARGRPPMAQTGSEDTFRRGRGLSMDLIPNPYLLPPGLQQSRESLHSLSRSFNADDDKYRPAITTVGDPRGSYAGSMRSPIDDSSSFTGSSRRRFEMESNRNLGRNIHRTSTGPGGHPGSVRSVATAPTAPDQTYSPSGLRKDSTPGQTDGLAVPALPEAARDSYLSTNSTGMNAGIRASNDYLSAYIRGGGQTTTLDREKSNKPAPVVSITEHSSSSSSSQSNPQPPPAVLLRDGGHHQTSPVASPPQSQQRHEENTSQARAETVPPPRGDSTLNREPRLPQLSFLDGGEFQQDFRLPEVNMNAVEPPKEKGLPPQPLEEATNESRPRSRQHRASTLPARELSQQFDTSQQRESQYDDYYDEFEEYLDYDPDRHSMGLRPLPPDDPSESQEQRANRIRSFYKEYFDDSKTPNGQHQMPHYFDGSEEYAHEDYYDDPEYYQHMPMPARGPRRGYAGSERHRPTYSTGSFMSSPRAMSTTSGQMGFNPRRPMPKKRLPPPKPLHNLPTPHLLKDDSVFTMDFAPPVTVRERRAGTPDSLRGGMRPYAPTRPGRNPLASSFDDLAAMPSP